jgi:dTMP kinase
MTQGRLLVIDGGDGTGKTEQTKLLVERMRRENHPVGTLSFPRYETPTGKVVRAYLDGAYGDAMHVSARDASRLYAADRWAALREGLFEPLNVGTHLVANRLDSANMGHQGSKIVDPAERSAFFRWNYALEHDELGIPRADLTVILHMPAETSIALIRGRGIMQDGRDSALDGHENIDHLKRAEATYLEIARTFPNYALIECVRDGSLLPIPEIHELVWAEVSRVLTLQPA